MAESLLSIKNSLPDPFAQGVVSLLWENSRIMPLLNFIPWQGMSYPYPVLSKLPGIGFRSVNSSFAPTQSVTNPAVETLSILGGRIQTDRVIDKVKPNYRSNEIKRQMEAAGKFWDKSFINGDPAVLDNSFMGLKSRISGTQLQTISTNGGPVTMDSMIALLDAVEGPNSDKVLLMNQTIRRNLSHDVGKSAGGKRIMEDSGMQEVGLQVGAMGSRWQTFNGARVVEVYYDEQELPILPFTEVCGSSGAACSSAYCFKPGNSIDERYVQGISGMGFEGHFLMDGPINFGEFLLDVIQGIFGIGVFSGYAIARLQGLTTASTG